MIKKVDHIGILVSNMDEAVKLYKGLLGAKVSEVETVAEQGVNVVMVDVGGATKLELLEPLPGSNMARTLEKRGEGVQHIALEVDDVEQELNRLSNAGVELIDKKSRRGLEGMVAFIHPKSVRGVLFELCQKI